MLCQIPLSWQISDLLKSLHFIEELQQYTTPGFFLSDCSFNHLVELVKRTYHAFGSTYSAHMAMSKNKKAAADFFNQFLDPSINTSFHRFDVARDHDIGDRPRDPGERVGNDDEGDDGDDDGIGIAHLADIDIQFGEECPTLHCRSKLAVMH